MAAAVAITFAALPPRRALAVPATEPAWRVPPRVYSPFPARRLTRPMAVPAGAARGEARSLLRGRRR